MVQNIRNVLFLFTDYHVMSFKFFILFALLHMFVTCFIFFKLGEIRYNQKVKTFF